MPALIQDRCTHWIREPERSSGILRAEARYSMGHRLWTAPSFGDRVTEISKEPEITKYSPLVWPAITASTPTITTTPAIMVSHDDGVGVLAYIHDVSFDLSPDNPR